MSTIKTIIFDLDNTLFDTEAQCVDKALEEAIKTMIDEGMQADTKDAFMTIKAFYKKHPSKDNFALLAKHYNANTLVGRKGKDRKSVV